MKQFLTRLTQQRGLFREINNFTTKSRGITHANVDISAVQIPRKQVIILDSNDQPFTDFDTTDIPGEWLAPNSCHSNPSTMLWLHGGAFIMGNAKQDRHMTIQFAKAGIRVLAIDYRLAPEHLFPKGLVDCISTWLWLKDQGIHAVLAGASAGGGLAIAAATWLRDHGNHVQVVAMSPSLDFTSISPSRWLQQNIDYLPWRWIPEHKRRLGFYLPSDDLADHPLVSPIWSTSAKVDMLIQVGDAERLKDDGILYTIVNSGDIQLEIYVDQTHVWQSLSPKSKPAKVAMGRIIQWIKGHEDGLNVWSLSPDGKAFTVSPLQVKDTLISEYKILRQDTVLQEEAQRLVDWVLVEKFANRIGLNLE